VVSEYTDPNRIIIYEKKSLAHWKAIILVIHDFQPL
jgi:hypothetical protein